MLTYYILRCLHILHSLSILVSSFWKRLFQTHPLPLTARRRRVPKHLAVLFVTDTALDATILERHIVETAETLAGWCRVIGAEKLTLYDQEGILAACSQELRTSLTTEISEPKREIMYPLTPPPSDYSHSRPLSPDFNEYEESSTISIHLGRHKESDGKMRWRNQKKGAEFERPLSLYILSQESSKSALASTARHLTRLHQNTHPKDFHLSIDTLNSYIEHQEDGLSEPDFMIVYPLSVHTYHRAPLELYGFPPWQIRLTEIHLNRYRKRHRNWLGQFFQRRSNNPRKPLPFTELEFRAALDEFSGADMRFGK